MLHRTPSRFARTSQGRSWNTGNGSPDAVCFSVDRSGVVVTGFCLYGGGGTHEYELELLVDDSERGGDAIHAHRWTSLEMAKGVYSTDDGNGDVAEVRLDHPVCIKEGVKYAVRLRNYGSRTANGDGGMTTVLCPDGVTFLFSACSLSSNGTNHSRGQMPHILYYRTESEIESGAEQSTSRANEQDQSRARILAVISAVAAVASELLEIALNRAGDDTPEVLSSSCLISLLLPLVLAQVSPVAASHPKVSVEVFSLVQQLLPMVALLNQKFAPPTFNPNQSIESVSGTQPDSNSMVCTTSNHYATLESEHPYKQATVCHYQVSFPESVRWMTVEFDSQCSTAQPEDCLRLCIPHQPSQSIGPAMSQHASDMQSGILELRRFSGSTGWPGMTLVFPGNELVFSLETASDYVKDDKASFYGFKCSVIGYEFSPGSDEGIILLEKELSHLGSMCSTSLMKKELCLLPAGGGSDTETDLEIMEEAALQVYKVHSGLLGKGLALAHAPTIHEALEDNLPLSQQCTERAFLDDFTSCCPGTSGGRLARWLQPDSYVEPRQTSVLLRQDELRCSWPSIISVQSRDQYGEPVHGPNLKVEVKAVPRGQQSSLSEVEAKKYHIPGSQSPAILLGDLTFGGLPCPKLEAPYEPTLIRDTCYTAITMMKMYEKYSFEELRLASPTPKRPSETMLVRSNSDGTYSANWTPGAVGPYKIHVTIDDIETGSGLDVEVKEPPKGVTPPVCSLQSRPKIEQQPNKMRKFVMKDSAGLRVRTHPSLQSEQIGVVKYNGTVSYVDEVHNDDGVWLRLSEETARRWIMCVNGNPEAWCLSFNQHLGRNLLAPLEEPKSIYDGLMKEAVGRRLAEVGAKERASHVHGGAATYHVVRTGTSGHNVRSRPNLRGIPVGTLLLGNKVKALGEVTNNEGVWIQLDRASITEFCDEDEGEAWSLACDGNGFQYLRNDDEEAQEMNEVQPRCSFPVPIPAKNGPNSYAQGFDFAVATPSFQTADDPLHTTLGEMQTSCFTPTWPSPDRPSDTAAFVPSASSFSIAHGPFVFGQSQSPPGSALQHGEVMHVLEPKFGIDSSQVKTDLSKHIKPEEKEARMSKANGVRSGRTQGKPGESSIRSASEALLLKSDAGKLRTESHHGRSLSPNHNSHVPPKTDSPRRSASPIIFRPNSPSLSGRSLSPKTKTLSGSHSRPSSPGTPRLTSEQGRLGSSPPLKAERAPRSTSPAVTKALVGEHSRPSSSGSSCSSLERSRSSAAGLGKGARSPRARNSLMQNHGEQFPQNLPATTSCSSPSAMSPSHNVASSSFRTKHESQRARSKSDSSTLLVAGSEGKTWRTAMNGGVESLHPEDAFEPGCKPSAHVVQENLHSEIVDVCTSRALTGNPGIEAWRKAEGSTETIGSTFIGGESSPLHGRSDDDSDAAPRVHFSIGKATPRAEIDPRSSPKTGRRSPCRFGRGKKDKNNGAGAGGKIIERVVVRPVKEALSPSVADCARTVFAAFLWHEGIVHDAMACASYLKFNPGLAKEGVTVSAAMQSGSDSHGNDSQAEGATGFAPAAETEREAKLKNRHSLAISTFPEAKHLPPPGSVNKNQVLSMLRESTPAEDEVGGSVKQVGVRPRSALPLTLQHLVAFWEEVSAATLHASVQNLILPSPGASAQSLQRRESARERDRAKKDKKKKGEVGGIGGGAGGGPFRPRAGNVFGDLVQFGLGGVVVAGGGQEKETVCELCGGLFPYPVTYHMRQAHPGCGRYAGGQGYNSSGNFCGGWAGNCGDGGMGGSTWYLICDACREKYLREKQASSKDKVKKIKKRIAQVRTPRALPPMEAQQVMKANAMFLLSLASSAESAGPTYYPHRPVGQSPCSANLPQKLPCLYLQTLARQHQAEVLEGGQDPQLYQDEAQFLRSCTHTVPFISVTPGASPQTCTIQEPNLKSLPPSLETSPVAESDGTKRVVFQRSYSVVASEYDKQPSSNPVRMKVATRRRVNSGDAEGGSSLLRHPSPELARLVVARRAPANNSGDRAFSSPVLAFVIQRHDLDGLKTAMRHGLRKAACRVFAMQAFNWLLCNVVQTTSLHDILWNFVASLNPVVMDGFDEREDEDGTRGKECAEQDLRVCEHPLSDILIVGDASHPLPREFHQLLQTISDLMMALPAGSALQQMALRCWSLKFRQSDHQFLHQSNVFHHINNILSKSDEGDGDDGPSNMVQPPGDPGQEHCTTSIMRDLTSSVEIKTSSRPAMMGSLTDGSTETFWESGDEDRNKSKSVTLSCAKGLVPRRVCVHVDNSRDIGNKVSCVTFLAGPSLDELCKNKQLELDSRHIGWVSCELPGMVPTNTSVLRIELRGPENTLRLRQVKVLGWRNGESIQLIGQPSASLAQQRNCEAETLRVFRLITSQVFGKLISGDTESTPDQEDKCLVSSPDADEKAKSDADLKEHMVGIIFSRSKLTNLQKQVCAHIVQAIRTEAMRVREEWEHALSSRENANARTPGNLPPTPSFNPQNLPAAILPEPEQALDSYCFELLSMVLALSGSNVGRTYLAQQGTLLHDLFSLLHTASPRVQRQVVSLLRRVLPEVTPSRLASVLGVRALPPADISDIVHSAAGGGEHRQAAILDVFLGSIAKALCVQVKAKGGLNGSSGKGMTTVSLASALMSSSPRLDQHWWLCGTTPPQIAEVIMRLIKDMAAGHLSESWSRVTKNAIAEAVIALTKLEDEFRNPMQCLGTTQLWLALASLCVLDQDHVDRLSSGRWMNKDGLQKQMPICDNHDDGETFAIIHCNICGNLCADCDRFLHLHRRTHSHQRQVFKEEEEAIKVDLHEGCGRTKLFWLMALADSKTLKAMVEFRDRGTGGKAVSGGLTEACRFCGSRGNTELSSVGSVCTDPECKVYAHTACMRTHACGHPCGGVKNESSCLPCLHGCGKDASGLKQDADDMCMICFTEALSAAPAVQLQCSHVFHLHCCLRVLENRWLGPRITFGFLLCPICKSKMSHSTLRELLAPIGALYDDVRRKALMRLEYEGLHQSEAIATSGARFHNDPAGYAMNRYAYYVCFKCQKAYFGGEARCDVEAAHGDDFDPSELICGGCSDVSRAQMCPKHGTDFLEYKCRYCCSVAVFFCFGTTHFCNPCHDDFQRMTSIPKDELPHCPAGPKARQLEGTECPLHVVHPATGEEFALGCGVCRNAHTF
uniref:E3 ubiquitin-protein ligase MYCBP2-like isoform X1 n=1 Tax=Myxine glutinosa TaxID=7769 RepID=UPI00358FE14E